MHDASGCNSTYTTHDEPRWYDMDSLIYVSAISEMEAIMGDDEKLIRDITEVAQEVHPNFIAVIGAPIPYMIGTDFEAIARLLEEENGVPCFGFNVNGMNNYTQGISRALQAIVDRFAVRTRPVLPPDSQEKGRERKGAVVNLVGVTPLDFAVNGSVASMREWLEAHEFVPGTSLSLECTLQDVINAGDADVNLVVSYGGLAAAERMEEKFGIPYVIGVPMGKQFADHLAELVGQCAESGISPERPSYIDIRPAEDPEADSVRKVTAAIGESVYQSSLAAAAAMEQGAAIRVLCSVDTVDGLLREGDLRTMEEDEIMEELTKVDAVLADPLFRPAAPGNIPFIQLPHEAFSGRIYDDVNPNLINRTLESAGLKFL